MECLLECIGFPPGHDMTELASLICREGEPVAWRGPTGVHLRYPFSGGLEVRLDREQDQDHWTLWPHFEVPRRLRVSVQSLLPLPDSPYDSLLSGIANPPLPDETGDESWAREDYALSTYLSDARRVPSYLQPGHVLAVSIAGFALDLSYLGPNQGVVDPYILEEPRGAQLLPTEADDDMAGCMQVSLRIRSVRRLENPLTAHTVLLLETDAPGRPLDLFVSPWQLDVSGEKGPRPGWRVEGTFVFTGRVGGGLPSPARHARGRFG